MSSEPPSDMLSFRTLAAATTGLPRLGQLIRNGVQIDTPSFIAHSSRGVVPHLSHDNLRDHVDVRAIYTSLEDFIERGFPDSPILSYPGPLRDFISLPSSSLLLLGARRCPPVQTAATNTDKSIAILTSVGFRTLEINDYIRAIKHLRPDAVLAVPDIPSRAPGKNRFPKMVDRTELWLETLLREVGVSTPVFAAVLPLERDQQRVYINGLEEKAEELKGIAFYDSSVATDMPEGLKELVRLAVDDPKNPHSVLAAVGRGIDVFNLGFLNEVTDAGIALEFEFPGVAGGEQKPMGWDLWETKYATDVSPLVEGCECYTCRKHHKAYIQHLLNAKEMTAWVLLQIHNTRIINNFFVAIRRSIAADTFTADSETFAKAYEPDLPAGTGEGPRVRGYQFKTGPGPKKNKKVFQRFQGEQREVLEEAATPPDLDADTLVQEGFAEKIER